MLKKKLFIQKLTAFLLLLIFTISITPKNYFHEVIADHKDISYCDGLDNSTGSIHQQGYACHFDNLVVTLPFVLENGPDFSFLPVDYTDQINFSYSSPFQYCHLEKITRGPPAV